MARKTNPNILRLGQTKEWESKYIEKKSNELSSYVFNGLEIKKFIYKFFNKNGLTIDSFKLSQSENFLHIFITYFPLSKIKKLITQTNYQQKFKLTLKKRKSNKFLKKKLNINKNISNYRLYNIKYFNKKFYKNLKINELHELLENQNIYNTKFQEFIYKNKKFRRLNALYLYKIYNNIKMHKNIANIKANLFLKKMLATLYLFTNNKSIRFSLKQLNNDYETIKTFSKKKKNSMSTNIIKLRKFQKNKFFKIGIALLYNFVLNSKSPELLGKYIAFYLKVLKRHNFFLNFLKTTLKMFLSKNFSEIKRIKILIKGRFNGSPRAKKKFLIMGIPPSLSLNSNINYSESTAFSPNGTFGVKVWTYKKI